MPAPSPHSTVPGKNKKGPGLVGVNCRKGGLVADVIAYLMSLK